MAAIQFIHALPFGAPAHPKKDCVIRAVAIAACLSYPEVEAAVMQHSQRERPRGDTKRSSGSVGIFTNRAWFKDYMRSLDFAWTATMGIGTGCTMHLCADELPPGRLVCMVSRHACAVIDGVLFDNHDCSRNGTRCVYGYWKRM